MTNRINYAAMVAGLAKPGQTIIDEMNPQKAHLLHMGGCMCEEAGEVYGVIKKHIFYNKPLTPEMREKIINELGDLEFYMEGFRQGLGITRGEVLDANMDKLATGDNARYKEGYSDQAAIKRSDKD